ncbi:hypothetical protein TNIN_462551 [Trichonephila inaurata madagascariensis]|uniref:Secreted protein n=1 Tax=Trichonephila inaurata madagascariensis TaxID=2747483 RepID=A0A8X6YRF6_9ARAC|nr:hypothetical protein TNIN_462551 [Trichonephila inaurata madagascariensis]
MFLLRIFRIVLLVIHHPEEGNARLGWTSFERGKNALYNPSSFQKKTKKKISENIHRRMSTPSLGGVSRNGQRVFAFKSFTPLINVHLSDGA